MLVLSLAAILTACVILLLELEAYGDFPWWNTEGVWARPRHLHAVATTLDMPDWSKSGLMKMGTGSARSCMSAPIRHYHLRCLSPFSSL
jgi:hypothetical protein